MLFNTFAAIREKLIKITPVQEVQWFNAQYDGIIHTQPILFVEFPTELTFDAYTKELTKVPLLVKIHIVTTAIADADNSVSDNAIISHEEIAQEVFKMLENSKLPFLNDETDALNPVSYQPYQKYKGWLITFITFSSRGFKRNGSE